MKKTYLILSGIFALWLAGALMSYDLAFLTKALVQFFASGESAFKDYFFLFWVTLCFLALAFKSKHQRKDLRIPLLIGIFSMGAVNFLSFLIFMLRYHIKLTERVLTYADRSISSCVLIHTHTMKPMLMPLIEIFNLKGLLKRTDPGLPYYVTLPHWLFYLGLPLALLTGYLFVKVLLQKEDEWRADLRWSFIAVYLISSFALVKSFFDGGLFSMEFIIYSVVFILTLYTRDEKPIDLWWKFMSYLGLPALIAVSIDYLVNPLHFPIAIREVGIFGFFPVFLFLAIYLLRNKQLKESLWLVPLVALLVWNSHDYFWGNALRLLNIKIATTDTLYLLNYNGDPYPYPMRYRDGKIQIHVFHPEKPEKAWDYYRKYHVPPAYSRLNIVDTTCKENEGHIVKGKLIPVKGVEPDYTSNSELFEYFKLIPCSPKEGACYNFEAKIKGCVPNSSQETVCNRLSEMGFKVFIIIPDLFS